jgi:hypothetical protein
MKTIRNRGIHPVARIQSFSMLKSGVAFRTNGLYRAKRT